MYLLIYLSLNEFCKFCLIVNRQSNLFYINLMFIYSYISEFFCICICVWVGLCVCRCMFVLVFLCTYVLPVAFILAAFFLSLFRLYCSKTIRVIHCYYLPKNPCKMEESLLSIISLGSHISFSCN